MLKRKTLLAPSKPDQQANPFAPVANQLQATDRVGVPGLDGQQRIRQAQTLPLLGSQEPLNMNSVVEDMSVNRVRDSKSHSMNL